MSPGKAAATAEWHEETAEGGRASSTSPPESSLAHCFVRTEPWVTLSPNCTDKQETVGEETGRQRGESEAEWMTINHEFSEIPRNFAPCGAEEENEDPEQEPVLPRSTRLVVGTLGS